MATIPSDISGLNLPVAALSKEQLEAAARAERLKDSGAVIGAEKALVLRDMLGGLGLGLDLAGTALDNTVGQIPYSGAEQFGPQNWSDLYSTRRVLSPDTPLSNAFNSFQDLTGTQLRFTPLGNPIDPTGVEKVLNFIPDQVNQALPSDASPETRFLATTATDPLILLTMANPRTVFKAADNAASATKTAARAGKADAMIGRYADWLNVVKLSPEETMARMAKWSQGDINELQKAALSGNKQASDILKTAYQNGDAGLREKVRNANLTQDVTAGRQASTPKDKGGEAAGGQHQASQPATSDVGAPANAGAAPATSDPGFISRLGSTLLRNPIKSLVGVGAGVGAYNAFSGSGEGGATREEVAAQLEQPPPGMGNGVQQTGDMNSVTGTPNLGTTLSTLDQIAQARAQTMTPAERQSLENIYSAANRQFELAQEADQNRVPRSEPEGGFLDGLNRLFFYGKNLGHTGDLDLAYEQARERQFRNEDAAVQGMYGQGQNANAAALPTGVHQNAAQFAFNNATAEEGLSLLRTLGSLDQQKAYTDLLRSQVVAPQNAQSLFQALQNRRNAATLNR